MLLEFKALIVKTEHKHVGLHQTNSDWSKGDIAFRLKTGSALTFGKELHFAVHFKQGNIAIWHETLMEQ